MNAIVLSFKNFTHAQNTNMTSSLNVTQVSVKQPQTNLCKSHYKNIKHILYYSNIILDKKKMN